VLSVPKKFLENAIYPVIIDPSFNSNAALDGYLTKSGYSYTTNTTGTTMNVGNFDRYNHNSESQYHYIYRSYVSFDTSSIPDDATIISSYLYVKTNADNSTARDFDNFVYRIDYGTSLGSSDWDLYQSGTSEGNILSTQNFTPETFLSLHVGESRINKTGRTQYTIKSSNETPCPDECTSYAYISWYTGNSASPPRLDIVYSRPPSPSNLQITTPPDDPTPTFTWQYTDPDGDLQASFQFQISTNDTFTQIIRDSGEVSSSEQTYTESNALQNGSYFARVKVKDNKGMWSGWSQFIMFLISGPQIITYEYDQVGNRTTKNDGVTATTYTYNSMNQLDFFTENGIVTDITYDTNGNMIKKTRILEEWYYNYDYENRLTKVEYFDGQQTTILGEYFYDGDGKRIKKVESLQTTIYIYLGWNIIFEKESSTMTETKYIFKADCGCHVGKVVGGTTYFLHVDHLGSLRQETDINGNTVWASPAMYEPFGELRDGGPANNEEGHLYTGKLRDSSTGLYYYGARYYDAKVGRFIAKDRFAGSKNEPQTYNPYIYVTNNPLKKIDPTGNNEKESPDDDIRKHMSVAGSSVIASDPTNGGITGGNLHEYYNEIGKEVGYAGVGSFVPKTLGAAGYLADILKIPQEYKQDFINGFFEGMDQATKDSPNYDWSKCWLLQDVLGELRGMLKIVAVDLFPIPFEGTKLWGLLESVRSAIQLGETQVIMKEIPWWCRWFGIGC